MHHHYHLHAIGNSLVGTKYEVSDELLNTMGVSKGHMTLIDADQRTYLLSQTCKIHFKPVPSSGLSFSSDCR
jgi:hypothetical protein